MFIQIKSTCQPITASKQINATTLYNNNWKKYYNIAIALSGARLLQLQVVVCVCKPNLQSTVMPT